MENLNSKTLEYLDSIEGGDLLTGNGRWDFQFSSYPVEEVELTQKGEKRYGDVREDPAEEANFRFKYWGRSKNNKKFEIKLRNSIIPSPENIEIENKYLEANLDNENSNVINLEIDTESYFREKGSLDILEEAIDIADQLTRDLTVKYIEEDPYLEIRE